uniref:Uncharacterized protein n=1 Tax=Anguilla anguilla TaxID=7936 RepID=A0A0E9S1K5_ANGAN
MVFVQFFDAGDQCYFAFTLLSYSTLECQLGVKCCSPWTILITVKQAYQ